MIRTRNFKARNERIETGVLVKSFQGRNVSVERNVEYCFQWNATGQCSKGESFSFDHGSHSGQRAQLSSSTSKAPTQTDGRKPSVFRAPRGVSLSWLTGKRQCKDFLTGKCHGTVMWFMAPSRMPEIHVWNRMQVWRPLRTHCCFIEREYSIGLCVPR